MTNTTISDDAFELPVAALLNQAKAKTKTNEPVYRPKKTEDKST